MFPTRGLFLLTIVMHVETAWSGTSSTNITRAMCSQSTFQVPGNGLRDLVVIASRSLAITNSDTDFTFWYEEIGSGIEATANNVNHRFFICSLDQSDISRYRACEDIPSLNDPNNPNGQRGAVKRYATRSRLREGRHTFYVRATNRSFRSAGTIDCGASRGTDTYEWCGPATTFDFEVDVTEPQVQLTEVWSPEVRNPRLGTAWEGYFDPSSTSLDFVGRLAQYEQEHVGSFARGRAMRDYVNSTRLMAEYQASEANIVRFECNFDGNGFVPCDRRFGTDGSGFSGTGYMRDGLTGLVYYEGIVSNGTTHPVPGASMQAQTSSHTLQVRAVDQAGNVGNGNAVAVFEWIIDLDPPTVQILRESLLDGGSRKSVISRAAFEFSSPSQGLFFECRIQCVFLSRSEGCEFSGTFEPCTSPFRIQLDEDLLAGGLKRYSFTVRATDRAANVGSCVSPVDALFSVDASECASYTWDVDINTPQVTLYIDIEGDSPNGIATEDTAAPLTTVLALCEGILNGRCLVNSSSVGFVFATPDFNRSSFQCQFDRPLWFDCGVGGNTRLGSPNHIANLRPEGFLPAGIEFYSGINDGSHYFKVRVVNSHGTIGNTEEWRWYSDAGAPVVVFTRTPPTLTRSTSAEFEFGVYPHEPGLQFQCSWGPLATEWFGCNSQSVSVVGTDDSSTMNSSTGANLLQDWTEWINADRPSRSGASGGGDFEPALCPADSATPGESPFAIECRVASTGEQWFTASQTLFTPCTLDGGINCRNSDQIDGRICLDYEVRFICGLSGQSDGETLLLLNAVNAFVLYVDGQFVAAENDWTQTRQFQIPDDFSLVAIVAETYAGDGVLDNHANASTNSAAGILVSMPELGIVSNSQWKCFGEIGQTSPPSGWTEVSYDDFLWEDADTRGYPGDDPWGVRYISRLSDRPSPRQHLPYAQWIWARSDEGIAARVYCRFSREIIGNVTGLPVNYSVSEGRNSLHVRVIDFAGNTQEPPSTFQWERDTTPPQTEIFFTPFGFTEIDSVGFGVNAHSARVGSVDAEFRFRAVGEELANASQQHNGYEEKSKFRVKLDGTIFPGWYCSPGSYLCGTSCRVIPACDRNLSDGIALDPSNIDLCERLLEGCDLDGLRTSPIVFVNLAGVSHYLEIWAEDPIGNIGNTTSFTWVVDVNAPVVSVRDGGSSNSTISLQYQAEPRARQFECIQRYQCGVAIRLSMEATVLPWSDCPNVLAEFCLGRVEHSVLLVGGTAFATPVDRTAISRTLATSTGISDANIQISTVELATSWPFDIVYTGAQDGQLGSRFAWESSSAVGSFLGRDINLTECLHLCTIDLNCAALYYTFTRLVCFGFDSVIEGVGMDTFESVSFTRRLGIPPIPAVEVRYNVSIRQPRTGGPDVVGDTVDALSDAVKNSNTSALIDSGGISVISTIIAEIECIGFGSDNPLNSEDLENAVRSASAIGLNSSADVTSVYNYQDARQESRTRVQIRVLTDASQANTISSSLTSAIADGRLFQALLSRNNSAYDRWGVNFSFVVLSQDSLSWLSSDIVKSATLSTVGTIQQSLQNITTTSFASVDINQTFPHSGFAVVVRVMLGKPESQLDEATGALIAGICGSIQFRVGMQDYLRGRINGSDTSVNRHSSPRSHRVTKFERYSIPPTIVHPFVTESKSAEATSLHRTHTVGFQPAGAVACTAGTNQSVRCLTDGRYNFVVRGIDLSGNVGPASSRSFVIDSVAPEVRWKRRPPAIANIENGQNADFDFDCNEVDEAGFSTCTYECVFMRGWVIPSEITLESCPTAPVSYQTGMGQYSFIVRAIDAAGNIGSHAIYRFEVDGDKPIATIVSGRPSYFTSNNNIQLSINASEPGQLWCSIEIGDCILNESCSSNVGDSPGHSAGTSYFRCGNTVAINALGAVQHAFPGGMVGDPPVMYRFRVVMEDAAGNLQDVPDEIFWTHDTRSPEVAFVPGSQPFPISAEANPQIGFTIDDGMNHRREIALSNDVPASAVFQILRSECSFLVGNEIQEFDSADDTTQTSWSGWHPCTSPYVANVSTGAALFMVRCTDAAGNPSNTLEVRWTVDGEPPVLASRGGGNTSTGELEAQGFNPAPSLHSVGHASGDVALFPVNSDGSFGTSPAASLKLSTFENGSLKVVIGTELINIDTVHFLMHSNSRANDLIGTVLINTDRVGVWHGISPISMRALLQGIVGVVAFTNRSASNEVGQYVGNASLSYSVYFEFYPSYAKSTENEVGFRSRTQCCIDNKCDSVCKRCPGTRDANGLPVCAFNCGSAQSSQSSRCQCSDVAVFGGWPQGYSEESVTDMSPQDSVPKNIWDAAWDCGEGGMVFGDLDVGEHIFGVRTIDRALRTSSTPLIYRWQIDPVAPVMGLVRIPPAVSEAIVHRTTIRASHQVAVVNCEHSILEEEIHITNSSSDHCIVESSGFTVSSEIVSRISSWHSLSVGATSLAGLQGVAPLIEWEIDRLAPEVEILSVEATYGSVSASVFVAEGASIECNLTRMYLDELEEVTTECQSAFNSSSPPLLTIFGAHHLAEDVSIDGVYVQRICDGSKSQDCLREGRVVYDHRDYKVELFYGAGAWLVVSQDGVALASLTTSSFSPEGSKVDSAVWIDINGEPLVSMSVTSSPCGGLCPNVVNFVGLPSGEYVLCVQAIDTMWNVEQSTCTEKISVVSPTDQKLAIEQASRESLQPCDIAEQEIPIAIAGVIGFAGFVAALSVLIYMRRKANAIALAAQHKASAVISSTAGFENASFEARDAVEGILY